MGSSAMAGTRGSLSESLSIQKISSTLCPPSLSILGTASYPPPPFPSSCPSTPSQTSATDRLRIRGDLRGEG
eukprot:248757-Hanusia_phi.AAC.1